MYFKVNVPVCKSTEEDMLCERNWKKQTTNLGGKSEVKCIQIYPHCHKIKDFVRLTISKKWIEHNHKYFQ